MAPAAVEGRWPCPEPASPSARRPSGPMGAGAAPECGVRTCKQPRPQPGTMHRHRHRGQWLASSAHRGGGRPFITQHWSRAGGIFALQQQCGPTVYLPRQQTVDTPPLSTQGLVTGPRTHPGVESKGSLRPGRSLLPPRALSSTLAGFPFHKMKSKTAPASQGCED